MSITTGTFPGVRIADMPDLGAVNDASSVVGERAGSGRFGALAFRSYVSSYVASGLPWVNVRDYGANGDGVANDTGAIQAAINAVRTRGGVVMLNPGVYMINATLELPTWVIIRGSGVGITTIRAMPNTAFDIIQTTGYASLVGTGSNAGTYQNGVFAITLDGNKAAGRTTGNCLSIYGYDYRIEDVECCNAPGTGFRSEWGFSSEVPVPAGGNSMEAHIYRLKTFNCGNDGLLFLGPHDSYLIDVTSFINAGRGIVLGGTTDINSGGCQLTNVHSYGNQQVGIQVDVPINANTIQGENNRSSGGIAVTANGSITGSNIIAYENAGYGISIAGNQTLVSGVFSFDNTGDGIDIAGWENLLSMVSTTYNGGSGLIIGPASLQNNISGIVAANNAVAGISVGSRDNRVTGIYSIFNSVAGLGVADGLSGLRLEGELNNNGTGTQFVFNTSAGANSYDLYIFTEPGQTAWSGVSSSYDSMRILTSGASMMPLNIVPRTNPQPGSVGEYVAAQLAEASAFPVTSGVPRNVVAIALQPGDWDVSGVVGFTYSTAGAGAAAWVSQVSSVQPPNGSLGLAAIGAVLGTEAHIQTGTARMALATATTVYLGAMSGFGSGTGTVYGTIQARRVL